MSETDTQTKEESKEAKRQALVAKVKEAEANLEQRSSRVRASLVKARDETSGFVAAHPFVSVGGSIVLGVVIGALIPRPHKRPTRSDVARMASEYGRGYLNEAREIAERSVKSSRKAMQELNEETADFRAEAREAAAEIADEARTLSRVAGRTAAHLVSGLIDRRS